MSKVKLPEPDWTGGAGQADYGNPYWSLSAGQSISANAYGIVVDGEQMYGVDVEQAEERALAVLAAVRAYRAMKTEL